jgi:putative tricarboxylic transport membrane protein
MPERVAAVLFLAASGLYLVASMTFPLGSAARPGPGFFPVGIGAFLCAVAVLFLLATLRGRFAIAAADSAPAMPRDARQRVIATAAGLVGFCLLLPWIGYPLAAFGFVALLLRRLGGGRWLGVLAFAFISAAASYYLFAVLLGVPLPGGVLFD